MLASWKTMTPREVFVSLLHAPTKVAGEWQPPQVHDGQERYPACRRTPQGQTVVWDRDGMVSVHEWCRFASDAATMKDSLTFTTRGEADAWLRDHGWILVEHDEAAAAAAGL